MVIGSEIETKFLDFMDLDNQIDDSIGNNS